MRRNLPSFIIALSGVWLGWTVLVDFFVVRTVFAHMDDFFQAGKIGIALFSQLNNLEIVISSILMSITAVNLKKSKSAAIAFVLTLLLFSISMLYFAWLTPKISEVTELWMTADLIGVSSMAGYPDLQQSHHFYHRLYIAVDTFKLGLIVILMSIGIFRGEKWK